jgi:transcriptional regulator with XRE-family HTH domain
MFVSYKLDNFGKELRKIRKSLGFNQKDVQKLVGVSPDAMRKIEMGQVLPRYDTLELLSVAYKQDLLDLLKSCRVDKMLLEFHDDLDYIITYYDKAASARLKKKLQESFPSSSLFSMINPAEFKQFIAFVDAVDDFNSDFLADWEKTKEKLIKVLRLTLPDFNLKYFKKFTYSYIEFRILLLISLFIAKGEDYPLSNTILYHILKTIADRKYSTKYIDFLILNIYFNIAYNYHMLDKHEKVIEAADAGIDYCLEHRTYHALFSLYYRKGIAQFHLYDEGYKESITTAFYILKAVRLPELLEHFREITEKNYGIRIKLV